MTFTDPELAQIGLTEDVAKKRHGRVHVYRWGDGGAHFHVWFVPRPLGRLDMSGHQLMAWEDAMPPATEDEIAEAGRRIAAAL